MKKLILLSLITVSSSVFASGHEAPKAAPWTTIEWEKTVTDMPQGNIEHGKELHNYGLCISCHGEQGIAPSRNAPNLAGNNALYTYKTLLDYQQARRNEGDGKSDVMRAATQSMSAQDMADLAAYYASQRLPAPTAAVQETTVPANIKKLVTKGDVSRMITPCASCHGVHGEGKGITPGLAGQVPAYFIRTMQAYKYTLRTNDVNEGMSQFTHDLTNVEIEALANYYANLIPKYVVGTKE